MNSVKKTYRFLAALTLLVFIANITVSAGISLAQLSCEIHLHGNPDVHDVCCNAPQEHPEISDSSRNCTPELSVKPCIHSVQVSDSAADLPALPGNSSPAYAAIPNSGMVAIPWSETNTQLPFIETAATAASPSLFLLNSTFLN